MKIDTQPQKAKFILLNEEDNIMVCCSHAAAGQPVIIDGSSVEIKTMIEVGHKIARKNISAGDKIIKYGAPIGSATQDISLGEHVHGHNIKSDYIASHSRMSLQQNKEGKI